MMHGGFVDVGLIVSGLRCARLFVTRTLCFFVHELDASSRFRISNLEINPELHLVA